MSDLINRRVAIKAIADLPNCYNGFSDTYDKAYIIGVLEELPTVDAVPVVRCKDCRFGRETCGNIECNGEYHGYDWYCPNGKKKEE